MTSNALLPMFWSEDKILKCERCCPFLGQLMLFRLSCGSVFYNFWSVNSLKIFQLCSEDFLVKNSSFQGAMTTEQIKNTELTSQDIVSRNLAVFAKEVPLAMAKDIQGLRAIFEEVGEVM